MTHITGISGLTLIFLIIAFALLLLISILGIFIIIEIKRMRKILMDVNQRLLILGQKPDQLSPESNITKISEDKNKSDLSQHITAEKNRKFDNIQQVGSVSPAQDKVPKHGSEEESDNPLSQNVENSSESLVSNIELKVAILKLLKASDIPLSLPHIARNLSATHFDGNYHPILNELGQLENEGQIEGASKGGKVYYKMAC